MAPPLANASTGTAAQPRPADPCTLVIFGARGDLTKRLLAPALYNLFREKLLPEEFAVIGVARPELSLDEFHREWREALQKHAPAPVDNQAVEWLLQRLEYVHGDFDDDATYRRLTGKLAATEVRYRRHLPQSRAGLGKRALPRKKMVIGGA